MDELLLLRLLRTSRPKRATRHRIVNPSREDGFFGLAFPQRKIIDAPEGRTPKEGKTGRTS